ncbi:MAG: hypothetical protein HYX48_02585 [Chlamydiales bacterium]|nr:hypothetical protein [Chlamydiales bacterium]
MGRTINQPIHTSCSTGVSPHRINDRVEAVMIKGEMKLDQLGKKWGVSILSGAGRAVYGSLQVIGAIFFFLFKICDALYSLRYSRGHALLSLEEAGRGLTYIEHGIENILRGGLEAAQLFAIFKPNLKEVRDRYYSEGRNVVLIDEERRARELADQTAPITGEYTEAGIDLLGETECDSPTESFQDDALVNFDQTWAPEQEGA